MRKHVASYPDRVWAVEGSNGAGRPLAQRLLADGEHVVDVPAKLSARARLFDTGHNRKTDAHDAHAVAVVAVRTTGLRVLAYDEQLEALRLLVDRRDELTRARIQTRQPAAPAAVRTGSGTVARRTSPPRQAKTILATVRPRDVAGKTRRRLAAEQIAELVAIEKKIKALTSELKEMVLRPGSTLMDLPGVGPVVAARTLADTGDVARFTDRNRFASWTGTAPIEASSGEIVRHRLSRAGNRRMNHMIHIAATTQIRLDTPAGPTTGASSPPARPGRSHALPQETHLRRPLPPAASPTPRRLQQPTAGRGSGRAPRGVTSIQRGRLTPAHRHFGSATSRTRTHDATRAHDGTEDHHVETPPTRLLTSEGCRKNPKQILGLLLGLVAARCRASGGHTAAALPVCQGAQCLVLGGAGGPVPVVGQPLFGLSMFMVVRARAVAAPAG